MSGVASQEEVLEDQASAVFVEIAQTESALWGVLADGRVMPDEVPVLEAEAWRLGWTKIQQGGVVLDIAECRVANRVADQYRKLGLRKAPNRHVQAEIEDLDRRKAQWADDREKFLRVKKRRERDKEKGKAATRLEIVVAARS
ncbi:MAG TPA: hypothetical protein VEY08_05725 [Chloroflexia bacterium]|nr:hypothetical protein [Chloroflexia bacterium]